jgi:hypothetical protein
MCFHHGNCAVRTIDRLSLLMMRGIIPVRDGSDARRAILAIRN